MITEPIQKIIDAVCDMYRRQYESRVDRIILYGSYAREDSGTDSDIDLVAIVDGDRQELQAKLKEIWSESAMLGFENDVIISPMIIPKREFEEYKDVLPYYNNILKDGINVG